MMVAIVLKSSMISLTVSSLPCTGVPGVKLNHLAEGMSAHHCALSLVGESIMYPQINDRIKLLHRRGISTFLVTNAQFPDTIR